DSGFGHPIEDPRVVVERQQGSAQSASQSNARLESRGPLGKTFEGGKRLLEVGDCLPIGRSCDRLRTRETQISQRLRRYVASAVVRAERRIVRFEVLRVKLFERLP